MILWQVYLYKVSTVQIAVNLYLFTSVLCRELIVRFTLFYCITLYTVKSITTNKCYVGYVWKVR